MSSENISNDIFTAAKKGDIEFIRQILETKDFTSEQYNEICKSVFEARNSYDYLFELIETKLPVDSFCNGDTLLQCAVKTQNLEYVKRIIEKGANVDLHNLVNNYNALYLSIEFNSAVSVEIFDLLLKKTEIKKSDYFYDNDRANGSYKNCSGWYFEHLLEFKQKEMLQHFLEQPSVMQMVVQNDKTLEVLASCVDFDILLPKNFIENDFYIDSQKDYFEIALKNKNFKIIPWLIKNNISPVVQGNNFVQDLLNTSFTDDKMSKSEYIEFSRIKPKIENYVKQCVNSIDGLLKENVTIINLTDKYSIITNLDFDEVIPISREYVISGYSLRPDKGWWIFIDSDNKKIIRYTETSVLLGSFSLVKNFLVFDEGSSTQRTINIYGVDNNVAVSIKADAVSIPYFLINNEQNKVAVSFISNKDFKEGVDELKTARVGIRVMDLITSQTYEIIPTSDINYSLASFDDELMYLEN